MATAKKAGRGGRGAGRGASGRGKAGSGRGQAAARRGRRTPKDAPPPARERVAAAKRPAATADGAGRQWHAVQRSTRQSPYKMRLVIDEIRGKTVNDALSYLAFSKKHAAKQIEKVIRSAVANAEQRSADGGEGVDVDDLYVKLAVINEGSKLKRFTPAAMG